jgi:hypothetical protein
MKRLAWLTVATMIGSGVFVASPASAQVQFGIGPEGPNVRVGPDDDRVIERRRIERRGYDDRFGTGSTGRCRTVTIREEDDNGDIVTRRVRRCR